MQEKSLPHPSQIHETGFRLLVQLALLSVILVHFTTLILVKFGPKPFLTNEGLTNGNVGLSEQRDLYVIASWWMVAILITVRLLIGFFGVFKKINGPKNISTTLFTTAILLLSSSFYLSLDTGETGNIVIPGVVQILLGALVLGALVFHTFFQKKYLVETVAFSSVVWAVFLIPSLFQWPGSVRDPGHFNFSVNELAAVGAGKFPLSDFVPQYSVLLGVPIAPFLAWLPQQSILIVLFWMILLQVICISFPALVLANYVNKKLFLISIFTISIVSVFTYFPSSQISATAYFMGTPLRTVFPVVLLTCLVFTVQRTFKSEPSRRFQVLCGLLSGLTALNNFEFGAPAATAAIIVLVATQTSIRHAIDTLFVVSLSALSTFLAYGFLGLIVGKPVIWSDWTLFARLFGQSGFMKVPLAWGGLHVAYVSIGIVGLAIAAYLRTMRSKDWTVAQNSVAVFLGFSSLWMLFTIPYFGGRSFASTLAAGHSLQFGMVLSGLIGFLYLEKNSLVQLWNKDDRVVPAIVLVILVPLVYVFSLVSYLPETTRSSALMFKVDLEYPYLSEVIEKLADTPNIDNQFSQILELSNHLELQRGIRSDLVFNNPAYLYLSDYFAVRQCDYLIVSQTTKLIEDNGDYSLLDSRYCQTSLAMSGKNFGPFFSLLEIKKNR